MLSFACGGCSSDESTANRKTTVSSEQLEGKIERPIPREEWQSEDFPETESYEQRRDANGELVKHGTYCRRGPNGEVLEEGEYEFGQRQGLWYRRNIGQVIEVDYQDGEQVATRVLPAPREFVVDFERGVPHTLAIPCGLGYSIYELAEGDGSTRLFRFAVQLEMPVVEPDPDSRQWTAYRVPSEVGRVIFRNTEQGLDLSPIREYQERE